MNGNRDALDLLPDGGLRALDALRRPIEGDPSTGTRYRVVTLDPNEQRLLRMLTTERWIFGVKTPFFGRREVLEQLYNAVRDATTERRLRVVSVIGPPGVGKTRLLAEMFAIIDPRERGIVVLPVACSATEDRHAGGSVIAQLVRRRFGIQPSDRESVAREKILEGVEPLASPRTMSATARMLGYLAGLRASGPAVDAAPSDMAQFRRSAIRALVQIIRDDAERAPQIIVVHRAQHLTDTVRGMLQDLVAALHDSPVVLMLVGEQEAFSVDELADAAPTALRIDVAPLSDRDIEREVRAVLERLDDVDDELVARIVAGANGIPRLAEENIRLLIQLGAIVPGDPRWRLVRERLPPADALPTTIEGASRARVQALSGRRRRVLEAATVFGYNLWVDGVVTLLRAQGGLDLGGPSAPWIDDRLRQAVADELDGLVAEGLLTDQPRSALAGQRELAFVHRQDRNRLYDELPGADRAALHRLAAQWLSRLQLDEPAPWYEVIGNHWEEGGRPSAAASCFMQAAEAARGGYALDLARSLHRRALGLVTYDRAETLVKCLASYGQLAHETGDFHDARAIYGAMLEASTLVGDVQSGAEAWLCLGRAHRALGDYERARRCIGHAQTLFKDVNDSRGGAAALDQLARIVWLEGGPGGYGEALDYFQQALEVRRRLGEPTPIAESLGSIANIEIQRGELDAARAHLEEALELRQRAVDRAGQAVCFVGLGAVSYNAGALEDALAAWRQGLELADYAGDRDLIGALLDNIGEVELELGALGRARAALEEAGEVTRDTGDQRTEADVLRNLAALAAEEGDFDTAVARIDEARRICETIGSRPALGQVLRTEGVVLSRRALAGGAPDSAVMERIGRCFTEASGLFESLGDRMELTRSVRAFHEHLVRHGLAAAAAELRSGWGELLDPR